MNNVEIVNAYRAAVKGGDKRKAEQMRTLIVTQNQGLVRRLVNRFARPTSEADADDAMQAGSMGLLRALEDYDPNASSFSTYAAYWIRDHMQRWGAKGPAVTRPRSASMPASIAKAAALFRGKHGREPTAADLNVTEQQLAEWSEGTHFVYLDEDANDEHGRNEIASDAAEAKHTVDRMVLEQCWDVVVQTLSPRQVEIAEAVLWRGETVTDVAARYGFVDHSYVGQLCRRIEAMLKRAVEMADAPASSKPRHVLIKQHLAKVAKVRAKKAGAK